MAVSIALLKLELLLMRHIYRELDPEQYPFFFSRSFLKQALKHENSLCCRF